MGLKEKLIKKQLTVKDENKQVEIITKIAKRLSTKKLKKGYAKLKQSKKDADKIAAQVIKAELERRGEQI